MSEFDENMDGETTIATNDKVDKYCTICEKISGHWASEHDICMGDEMNVFDEAELAVIIDNWYISWKGRIVDYDNRTHRLGMAKEELKRLLSEKNDK